MDKLLFVHSALKNIKCYDSFGCKCWKNRIALPANKHLSADTCLPNQTPSILGGLYGPPLFPARLRPDSVGLWVSRMDIFLLYQCRKFPVTFPVLVWCLSSMESESNGLSRWTLMDSPMDLHPNSSQSGGNQQKVQWTPTGLQLDSNRLSGWTPDGQSSVLHRPHD